MTELSDTTLGKLINFKRGYDLPKSDFKNGNIQMHQLSGSSGYLSQSGPVVYIGDKSDIKKMIIKWPNGSKDEINFSNSPELFSSTF